LLGCNFGSSPVQLIESNYFDYSLLFG